MRTLKLGVEEGEKRSRLILWLCELLESASEGYDEFIIPEGIECSVTDTRQSSQQP